MSDPLSFFGRTGPIDPPEDDDDDNLDAEVSVPWTVDVSLGKGVHWPDVEVRIHLHGLGSGLWEWVDYDVEVFTSAGPQFVSRSRLSEPAHALLDPVADATLRDRAFLERLRRYVENQHGGDLHG